MFLGGTYMGLYLVRRIQMTQTNTRCLTKLTVPSFDDLDTLERRLDQRVLSARATLDRTQM